ncbi:MAG: (d)CMP kinase [Actinomycetota bacterium]|nr:(d)CMP kinase [Actinomycetota bacterium]
MGYRGDWEELSVAIDGVAGAGKSTIGRALAREIGITYLDTGATYRALAFQARELGIGEQDSDALTDLAVNQNLKIVDGCIFVDERDVSGEIRTPEVSSFTSKIATIGSVRAAMVSWQRSYAEAEGGVVGDGRDCGTVVLKGARLKVFLDADPVVRASRRNDLSLEDITERDLRDSTRSIDPLRVAEGAVIIDTSKSSIEESVLLLARLYDEENSKY